MSSPSALECSEDLENVTLVRMEDVQPDRSSEVYILGTSPYVNRMIDHDYSCVFNDEDSNIGSMVSIHSEEVEDLIESQVLEVEDLIETQDVEDDRCKATEFCASNPDSWPTLEILPGGVIKHSEKYITSLHQKTLESDEKDLIYACAKCPQRFKFLYNLVKHVKLHEEEKKKRSSKSNLDSKTPKSRKITFVPVSKRKAAKYKSVRHQRNDS